VNGVVKRNIGIMAKFWQDGDTVDRTVYLDSSGEYDGPPTRTITGLTWLAGEKVGVLVDGATHPDVAVSDSGEIRLKVPGSVVQVGYNYTSVGQTLRIEAGGAEGPAQGKLKRIRKVVFRLYQSIGLTLDAKGSGASPPIPLSFRDSHMLMDKGLPTYSGDFPCHWEGTWDLSGQVRWYQDQPLPSNIQMLSVQLDTQEGR
jgi:hypothetical protein